MEKPKCSRCGNDRQIDLVVRYSGHYWHTCENRFACNARSEANREAERLGISPAHTNEEAHTDRR